MDFQPHNRYPAASYGVFDPRGISQIGMQACPPDSLPAGIKYPSTGAPMPFFMAYPDYCKTLKCEGSGEEAARDFEYLRQMYPGWVGRYRQRVEELLDRMDYEGSMIYDEFPDRLSLYEIADTVTRCILREDGAAAPEGSLLQMQAGGAVTEESFPHVSDMAPPGSEAGDTFRGLIQVLVCNEIYRRRQRGERIKR